MPLPTEDLFPEKAFDVGVYRAGGDTRPPRDFLDAAVLENAVDPPLAVTCEVFDD